MTGRKLIWIAGILCLLTGIAVSQQADGAAQQSPRKAILEMLSGNEEAFKRHLTVEVQQKLGDQFKNPDLGSANPLQAVTIAKAMGGDNLETFDAGPILLSYNDPQRHERMEIRIDSEDVQGDQDYMQISFHAFHNGAEEDLLVGVRLFLAWKLQQSIWRLNAVTVNASFPVGDPRFLDRSHWVPPAIAPLVSTTLMASDSAASSTTADIDAPKMTAARAVRLFAVAENLYAKKHPEVGFTCFITELVGIGRGMDDGETYTFMSPEFANGIYNGYKFSLNGCAGKPAKSFHVMAEPVSGTGRAYCSDTTRDLHASDDGSGATCVLSGKLVQR